MDERDREREQGQPDPTHDTWSAWLPQLDSPTSGTSPTPQDTDAPGSAAPPVPPPPPVRPTTPLPQASLPPPTSTRPTRAGVPSTWQGLPLRAYAGRSAPRPQGGPQAFVPPPPNRLGLAILCTILCFMPFGIVALVKAASVNGLWAMGRVDEAQRASRSVRTWCVLAALVWPVLPMLMFGLFIVIGIARAIT